MPKFEVTSPDGRTFEVNAPQGATQDDAIEFVQNNIMKSQPQQNFNVDPTEGMSTTQRTLAGIGQGMTTLGRGIGQRLGMISQKEIDEAKKLDAPLLNTTAGTVGNIVGQGALLAPTALIPGANTLVGSTIVGGAAGGLQPTATGESVTTNVIGGVIGSLLGKVAGDKLGKVLVGRQGMNNVAKATTQSTGGRAGASANVQINPSVTASGGGAGFGSVGDDVSAGLTRSQNELAKRGQELGFKLTPGQATGSRALQQFEAKLESQPMTSGAFNAVKEQNQKALNRIAAKSIGVDDVVVDSNTLAKAQDKISNIYKFVANDKKAVINGDDVVNRLAKVESDYEGLLPVALSDNPLVKRYLDIGIKGEATGEQLQNLASKLGKAANNQMTTPSGDRQLGIALFEVKDSVDDMLASTLDGKTKSLFDNARGNYRNLMLLTQRQGVVNPSNGNVSGVGLSSVLQGKDRQGFLFGKNASDLYDAARFAQAFKPIVGDSGTATRSQVMNPTDFVLSLPGNIVTKAYTSAPSTRAFVSAQNIGEQGLTNLPPELVRRLPQAGLLGGSVIGANAQ